MYHSFLIRPSTDGHLDCVQHLAIVNSTAMNIGVHKSFWISVLGFLGYIPNSGITGTKGSSIFRFLRKFPSFPQWCTSLHSHQRFTRIPFSPQPHQHFLVVDLLMMDIQTGVRWYLIVILICISLMASDVEHFFICLWALCMSSSEKCLFRSFSHFLTGLFVFLVLSHMSSLYIGVLYIYLYIGD